MIGWQEKERLRARYDYRCGYCGLTEVEAGRELTIDHFQPVDHGGSDDTGNLVYACRPCNEIKGNQWNADSPPVLHPLHDDISRHIQRGTGGVLLALTEAGARHIEALRLNRPLLLARRCGRVRVRPVTPRRRS